MPVDALLFIKPVRSDDRTLNKIINAVPSVGYEASRTVWDIAESYGIDGREYPLCIPLTRSSSKERDWAMSGVDDINNYKDTLKKKIPEIQDIEIRFLFNKAKYKKQKEKDLEDATEESLDELT
jgi:hypothetical protein